MIARRASVLWCAIALAAAAGLRGAAAAGQTVDVERARTLVVGAPAHAVRMDRGDGARTGLAQTPLPASGLRIAWSVSLGLSLKRAPLVNTDGEIYVASTRGDVVAVGPDGTERWRVATGASQPGPLALLSDSTVVFVDDAGEAVGVRSAHVRFRTRFGRAPANAPAPLPLDDGGVVVATEHELAVLDADGAERARTTLAEAISLPLLSALGKVIAVTSSGAIWSWGAAGTAAPMRVGTFGAPIDGSPALADDHTLVAVIAEQARLGAVDLARGTSAPRAATSDGLWLGPPAMRGAIAYVPLSTATGEFVVAVDPLGTELGRTILAGHPSLRGPDGGAAAPVASPHTPPIVDAIGTFVFATSAGDIGAASGVGSAGASVEVLSNACPPAEIETAGRSSDPPVVGLAPLPPKGLVAACNVGTLLAIRAGRALDFP